MRYLGLDLGMRTLGIAISDRTGLIASTYKTLRFPEGEYKSTISELQKICEEEKIDKSLRNTDIITRVGPTLGLMGTLIPLGPGLAALGAGDVNTLADALTIAFDTTVVGIGSGALCYFISKIRRGWYDQYLSDLDALSDAVLFFMNKQ